MISPSSISLSHFKAAPSATLRIRNGGYDAMSHTQTIVIHLKQPQHSPALAKCMDGRREIQINFFFPQTHQATPPAFPILFCNRNPCRGGINDDDFGRLACFTEAELQELSQLLKQSKVSKSISEEILQGLQTTVAKALKPRA